MQRCGSCGAGLTAGAAWCGQCYARLPAPAGAAAVLPMASAGVPTGAGRFATGAGVPTGAWRPAPAPEALGPPPRYTRWRKTQTTFGPVGRVLCTLGLLGPFLFLVVMGVVSTDPFVLVGGGIWAIVIMPWGLRDTWRAGQLPVH